ncbi:MAG: iron complex outermembrane receptor protein, partial [Nonlabens sp.]
MKKLLFAFILLSFFTLNITAQNSTISGIITDADTAEPLIGAAVFTEGSIGTITDFNGAYSLSLKNGKQLLKVSYVSYESKEIEIDLQGDQVLDIKLDGSNLLNEVVVTADIAIERETPVAFTNISTKQLDEELASQDIPMILNSTPGAYATEGGGGDGDARITIRGFNQRNIAVMLDGIPVNDMENGRVFWSNWFGLDLVTQTMQVQRGLGASKLSIPSIGGTINILTKGIDAKKGLKFKQEVGSNGYTRSTIGLTSGRLKNGFGISAAASYKQGDGWVDGNFTRGFFYYLRIDKQLGNHMLSFSGFGAPQEHGQRPFTYEAGLVDTTYAKENGVPASAIAELSLSNKGRRYNEHWGYKGGELYNTRKNFYHKPQFSLRHSYQINSRMFLSNVAYLSIGKGGGTAREGVSIPFGEDDQLDIDQAIAGNQPTAFNPNGLSNTIIRASKNEHFWYGLLSTLNYTISPTLTFSGGVDARSYQGDHYREVYDLLGGQGYTIGGNFQEGDRFDYDYTGYVKWIGGFALLEYQPNEKFTYFLNASRAYSYYSFYDNFSNFKIDDIRIPTGTYKSGANFNINESNSIFANVGYLGKAQRYNNVIISNLSSDARVAKDFENEIIKA